MNLELLLSEALILETVDLCHLRNRIYQELCLRAGLAIIGRGHTPEEIKAFDEKVASDKAMQGRNLGSGRE
jgi:hypothetical protein